MNTIADAQGGRRRAAAGGHFNVAYIDGAVADARDVAIEGGRKTVSGKERIRAEEECCGLSAAMKSHGEKDIVKIGPRVRRPYLGHKGSAGQLLAVAGSHVLRPASLAMAESRLSEQTKVSSGTVTSADAS